MSNRRGIQMLDSSEHNKGVTETKDKITADNLIIKVDDLVGLKAPTFRPVRHIYTGVGDQNSPRIVSDEAM